MNHHAVHYVVGAIALMSSLGGVVYTGRVASTVPKAVTVVATTPGAALTAKQADRAAALGWGELEQREVDAITAILEARQSPHEVVVLCGDRHCEDLALDLENAFESAHWTITTERPLYDPTTGLSVSAPELVDAITRGTNGRLKPALIKMDDPRWVIVLGRKAR